MPLCPEILEIVRGQPAQSVPQIHSNRAPTTRRMEGVFSHLEEAFDNLTRSRVNLSEVPWLALPESPPDDGFACWDDTKCGLCSRFLDRSSVFRLFIHDFLILGNIFNLVLWSQPGQRCLLCVHILRGFVEATNNNIPTDAHLIVRWGRGENGSDLAAFTFEMTWGFPARTARMINMPCLSTEGKMRPALS